MILDRIDDPRDKLQRATRDEVYDFAVASGVTTVTIGGKVIPLSEQIPKPNLINELRARGLTNIRIPNRPLGAPPGVVIDDDAPAGKKEVVEVNADDDLARQVLQQLEPDVSSMSMAELRSECKRRGIKMDRTDNMQTLRDKLRV